MQFHIENENKGNFLVPASYLSRKNHARTWDYLQELSGKSKDDPFYVFGHRFRYTDVQINDFTTKFGKLREVASKLFVDEMLASAKATFDTAPHDRKASITLGPTGEA